MSRKKQNPVVHISFLDHAANSGSSNTPAPIDLFGVLYKEDKDCYYIASWICDHAPTSADSDTYAVVKHPSVKIRKLK